MRPQRRESTIRRAIRLGLSWGVVVMVLVLLAWGGMYLFVEMSGGTKKVTQSTADTPIYVLGVGVDDQMQPCADGIVLLSMNRDQQYGAVISLLPETDVARNGDGVPQLLGDAYREGGIQLLKEKVESTLHIFIPYYVVMRLPAAEKWLNTRGTIGFYVEKDLYRQSDAGEIVNLRQGFQQLDGNDAVAYLRYREDGSSSLARVQRQQRLMKAYLKKLRLHIDIVNWFYTKYHWAPDETNISASDAADILEFLTELPEGKLEYYIVPGEYRRTESGGYWHTDPIEVQAIIGSTLHPHAASQQGG